MEFQNLLRDMLRFERTKARSAITDPVEITRIERAYETNLVNLWRIMAALWCDFHAEWTSDPDYPGYVQIQIGSQAGKSIHVPFHLATENADIWDEVAGLAGRICIGEVNGRKAAICLSGSTVIWSDFQAVGDIDFCEYVPTDVDPDAVADAFLRQVQSTAPDFFSLSLQLKRPELNQNKKLDFIYRMPNPNDVRESVRALVTIARNGKTSQLVETSFAGVTEMSNWLIFHDPLDLEADPTSGKSFAFQEASIGTPGRRKLSAVKLLTAYMVFLRNELAAHAQKNPGKYIKRAVPWLRLFGAVELQDDLLELASKYNVPHTTCLLAKLAAYEEYAGKPGMDARLQNLLSKLEAELTASGITPGQWGAFKKRAEVEMTKFGGQLNEPDSSGPSRVERIISLADSGS
jgi:hypothetical protein